VQFLMCCDCAEIADGDLELANPYGLIPAIPKVAFWNPEVAPESAQQWWQKLPDDEDDNAT